MPTYDYECGSCGHDLEIMQSIKDKPLNKCPKCGSKKFARLISGGAGIVFKGSGFYATDSRQSVSNTSSKDKNAKDIPKESSTANGENNTKSETKTDTPPTSEVKSNKKSDKESTKKTESIS